jgi:uncharacterized protein (TIGR00369 family)
MSGMSPPNLSKPLSVNVASDYAALLQRIQAIPVFNGLGVTIVSFAPGECVAVIPRHEHLDGIFDSYHGGMLTTAADTIACFAVMTQTGADSWLTTTDLNVRFLRACLTDVTVKARVIKVGKLLCPVAVDLLDADGQLVAVAQVTFMRLNGQPKHSVA